MRGTFTIDSIVIFVVFGRRVRSVLDTRADVMGLYPRRLLKLQLPQGSTISGFIFC